MRQVGKRKLPVISAKATSELLLRGAAFNDEIHQLPTGDTTYFQKGVYRYKTHEEANAHWDASVIAGMVRLAKG